MNRVLFVGFSPIQLELIKKFIAFRKLEKSIVVVSEQQASDSATAYVVNGDDPSAASRLALHLRVNKRRVLGVGSKAVLGVTTYAPGPFKPATIDRLVETLRPEQNVSRAVPAPAAPKVVSFPSTGSAPQADILVVDDSEIVRRTMVKKINEFGQRADVAEDGDDAMAMLLSKSYKLVFLDVMMPGTDGLEVCKRLKKSAEYKASAIYMLTSKDGMFDKVRASLAGCDGYLVKPLESRKLKEVLAKFFEKPSSMPDSDLIGSMVSGGGLNAAERAAVEGYPEPAEEVRVANDPTPKEDFKPTFAATEPAPVAWKNTARGDL